MTQPSRWRRPRWADTDVDVDWHVVERRSPGGAAGVRAVVAELAEQPMPRDRPLWRLVLVRDEDGAHSALLVLVHHTMADGIGTVTHALSLFRPRIVLPGGAAGGPGPWQRAAATAAGLAQLATDGGARRLPTGSARRQYGTAHLDLDAVRRLARSSRVRVTDVVLALVADAVHATRPDLSERTGGTLRVSVTQMVRAPGAGPEGNATAAVMVGVPVDDQPFETRLAEIARRTTRLRKPTRAVASRFVMTTGLRLLPEPATGWFARTVYGGRFFHAVVSNLPGPAETLTMGDTRVDDVFPVLPVAPDAPLSVGALSWAGALGFGIATDPALLDADAIAGRIEETAAGLLRPCPSGDGPGEGEEETSAFAR